MHSIAWTFAFLYLKWCNWVIDPLSLCISFFPLLIWSLSMFWCSIKTVCYRSLAVIYFRRSKSNVRHFDFWSGYLVCMHLNNKILGYFYLHIFPKLFLTHFGRQCIFRKPTCKAIGYVTFVPYPENSFYFLSPNKIYWNG